MEATPPMKLCVRETAGAKRPRPVTGGVPLPQGAAPADSQFILKDDSGNALPLQHEVLSHWPDGSARWVLLDFQASPDANDEASYALTWDGNDTPPTPPYPIVAEGDALQSGVRISAMDPKTDIGILQIADRLVAGMTLVDANGQECKAKIETIDTTTGALRAELRTRGNFFSPAGDRVFQFRLDATLYAGLGLVRLRPCIVVDADREIVQRIRALDLTLRVPKSPETWRIGAQEPIEIAAGGSAKLMQRTDRSCVIDGNETDTQAPGWVEWCDAQGAGAIALRDFWQQWPKALSVLQDTLTVGLFPAFESGAFDDMLDPWWKHDYLFEGDCYRLRTGQARRWDIWIDLEGDGERLARIAEKPLIVSTDPAQTIATGAWGFIAPAGTPGMEEYDIQADAQFETYGESLRKGRDYGAMNWGDWFGERHGVNWGNHEYDTTNQMLLQFARTGDPKYCHAADRATRHVAEVDTVHALNPDLCAWFDSTIWDYGHESHVGMVHQHGVGHVGGFHTREQIRDLYIQEGMGDLNPDPYPCLDPFNLGHLWTDGMARAYFLSGDPFLRETLEQIGENVALVLTEQKHELIQHTHCGRMIGWPLQALAAVCEAVPDERYLAAMREIVDVVLDAQDSNCGGWLTTLPTGHCNCETKHVGMAGFITSVMVNGLSRYYRVTGDERIPKSVERAITFLDNDTWLDERADWRYTSCPASRPGMGWPGVTILAHVNAIRLAGNPEHRRVLEKAWAAKLEAGRRHKPNPDAVDYGKAYASKILGCPEAASLIAELNTKEQQL